MIVTGGHLAAISLVQHPAQISVMEDKGKSQPAAAGGEGRRVPSSLTTGAGSLASAYKAIRAMEMNIMAGRTSQDASTSSTTTNSDSRTEAVLAAYRDASE